MRCPRCGSESSAGNERCIACGHMPAVAPTMATGVLTPFPPSSQPFSDPDVTRLPDSPTEAFPPNAETLGFDADTTGMPPLAGGRTHTRPAGTHTRAATAVLTDGQLFGTRYRIISLLGMGGMGAVYQAWDGELDVVVALKVIRPEAISDPEEARAIERRFKQELLLARQVTHKNVVRIHDLGEIDGIKYITMSYMDGEDLSTVLKREGKLPVPEALRILRQVASGLVAAHDAGVVHRDLKPANIMIEGGNAVIMDFGIARSSSSVAAAVPPGASGIWRSNRLSQATQAGAIVGTIAYMAPEQAKGESVDQRADIYALGLIMSDTLLGRQEKERTTLEELRRRSVELPRPLRSVDPGIPEALDQIVVRCLQPDPEARFATTSELVAALDRLDKNGVPLPLVRRLTGRMMAATALVGAALLGVTFYISAVAPPVQHDPVSVLIADFQNQTGDPAFDRSLESVLKLALEGAGFITAYDRTGVRALGGVPPDRLDERAALEIAVKQGVAVVVSGVLERDGEDYGITVKATQAVTGNVITTATDRAAGKDRVLAAATGLATTVRTALGDETEDSSSQIFAMDTLSTTNLEVVRQYAVATEQLAQARFDDALQSFSKAVELDPTFGVGYQGMALASRNLDRPQDAERYIKEALRYLDRMTERERFRARGFFYRVTGDYQACVKEYGDLIARYAADVAAHNQIALCSTYLRDMPRAVEGMRRVVQIVPKSTILRNNLALYLAYSGDFRAAEQEARGIENPGVNSFIALAFAQLGQGQVPQALDTYQKLTTMGAQGASRAMSGAADVAIYQGRFDEAARILGEGAAADAAAQEPNRAAAKFAALAYAQLSRGQNAAAIAAANSALKNSQIVKIRSLAGRTLAEAGDLTAARSVAASLASEIQAEPRAHAKIIEGLIFLKGGDAPRAITALTEANSLLDTWLGHFDLGRAYLAAGQFKQADAEFDLCIKRGGEALSLFLEEEPTYGYFPETFYYQGRVREGLNSAGFVDSYRAYLAIRGQSKDDSLLPDVRRRVGG
jgi:eukaryotic-like serine/threonine-protein kinase